MKQIGAEIGVNESRVSQLHARAIRRLREALEQRMPVEEAREALRGAILEFQQRPKTFGGDRREASASAVVVNYTAASRAQRSKSPARKTVKAVVVARRATA
jgi:hypothetical protein